jgi:hypothetical protein
MFNNKTVKIAGYVIGAYLLLKMVLTIIMYIWALFEVPPMPIINPEAPGALITLLDTIAIYAIEIIVVGLLVKYMVAPAKFPPAKTASRKSKK